jgi:hypothetical protein
MRLNANQKAVLKFMRSQNLPVTSMQIVYELGGWTEITLYKVGRILEQLKKRQLVQNAGDDRKWFLTFAGIKVSDELESGTSQSRGSQARVIECS